MSANPNWARWFFSSVADRLKAVALDSGTAVLVEHLDARSEQFINSTLRAEIRITGPFTQKLSEGYHRVYLDANVLLTSSIARGYDILRIAGLFHEAMDGPIPIWNYGDQPGDYDPDDPETQLFLGCLLPKPGNSNSVRVFNFGQLTETDKLKQTAIDARYVTYL
jgi:hypothetical protein